MSLSGLTWAFMLISEADQPHESPTHSCKNDLLPNVWTDP